MKEKVNHHNFDLHRFGIIGNMKIALCKLVGHRLNEIEDHPWCSRCGYCYEDIYYKNNTDTNNVKVNIMNNYMVFQKYSDSGKEFKQQSIPLSLDEATAYIKRVRKSYPDRYYTILQEIQEIDDI